MTEWVHLLYIQLTGPAFRLLGPGSNTGMTCLQGLDVLLAIMGEKLQGLGLHGQTGIVSPAMQQVVRSSHAKRLCDAQPVHP